MPDGPDDDIAARVAAAVSDAAAVVVGLGVLTANRIQALRRQVAADRRSGTSSDTTVDPPPGHAQE